MCFYPDWVKGALLQRVLACWVRYGEMTRLVVLSMFRLGFNARIR